MPIEERDSNAVVTTACPYCDAALPEQTSLAVHLAHSCPATVATRREGAHERRDTGRFQCHDGAGS